MNRLIGTALTNAAQSAPIVRWRTHVGLILLAGGLTACQDALGTKPRDAVARKSVTAELAASLDAEGRFVLNTGPHAAGEIDGATAKRIAAAMWHDNSVFLEGTVSKDRGAAVHSKDLAPCGRAYYARSAYAAIPHGARIALDKTLSAHWLVGLCYGSVQEVVVAVSAHATDVTLSAGEVHLTGTGDANFFTAGVPVGSTIPFEPELVADIAADKLGRRVAQVPELIQRAGPHAATVALWRVTLDGPVSVTGDRSKASRSRVTLFAGAANGWMTPALADELGGSTDSGVDIFDDHDARTGISVRREPRRPRESRAGQPRGALMRNQLTIMKWALILISTAVVGCGGNSGDGNGSTNTVLVINQAACATTVNEAWQNEVYQTTYPTDFRWCPLLIASGNRAKSGGGFADVRLDRAERPAGWEGVVEMWMTHRSGQADTKQVSSFFFSQFAPYLIPQTNVQPVRGQYTIAWTAGVVSASGQQETDSVAVLYGTNKSYTNGLRIAMTSVKAPVVITTLPGNITGPTRTIAQTAQSWQVITDWDTTGYNFQWRVNGAPVGNANGAILRHSFDRIGTYTVGVDQTLSDGTVLVSNQVITVPFTALLEGPGTVAPTMAAHFAASAPGGDLPYTYAWTLDNEPYNVGSVSSIDIWPGEPGTTHMIGVTIRDASGNVSFVSNSVSVLAGGSDFNRVEPVPVLLDTPAPARPKGSVGGSVARKSH